MPEFLGDVRFAIKPSSDKSHTRRILSNGRRSDLKPVVTSGASEICANARSFQPMSLRIPSNGIRTQSGR